MIAPALLAYFHIPLEGPNAAEGRAWLDEAWRVLGEELGFTEPVPGLGAGTELSGGTGLLAARQRDGDEVWQASVRLEHDVRCLTVMMAPPRDRDCAEAWAGLEAELARLGRPAAGVLGETRILLALDPEDDLEALRTAVPGGGSVGWSRRPDRIAVPGGVVRVWETGPPADDRVVRRLVAVAPVELERRLDRLVWTTGDGELTALARHLMHAAKLRYQVRVFLRDRAIARGRGTPEEIAPALRVMRRGVGIIVENLRKAISGDLLSDGGPVADDLALGTWFLTRLDDELDALGSPRDARPEPVRLSGPDVFVSYIHDSEQHKKDVRVFADLLRDQGVNVHLDQYYPDVRRDWYEWMLNRVPTAAYVIVVASPMCRIVGDAAGDPAQNLGGRSEMGLLRELMHSDRPRWTRRMLPVVLPGRSVGDIPLFLQPRTMDHYLIPSLTAAGVRPVLVAMKAAD
ncbi:SEFIR domain-containing protein [Lentzea waywayandensis]|uniref:SEFIR domain-containing protein n=1 Tax=Lentzea waywayandensis TaxID=84724 RepID=A0A1I6FIH0_9PSEU|nr:CATRA conflict system CASPASE/TPR repeat-associated protein [Lentzea waywayandensis]SFR29739.1 SEFIR domain-containing protein [Lentzea waywayandensis]